MHQSSPAVFRLTLLAAGFIAGCAAPERSPPASADACPAGQVMVCAGGRVERGRLARREPRVCECQADTTQ